MKDSECKAYAHTYKCDRNSCEGCQYRVTHQMKEYLVTLSDNNFIVLAKNAKDAITQVWEEHFEWKNAELREENNKLGYHANHIYAKSELKARSLDSLHNEQGKIINLW